MLFVHCTRRAASRAACTAGSNSAIRTAMIAITTRSSISVNPPRRRLIKLPHPSRSRAIMAGLAVGMVGRLLIERFQAARSGGHVLGEGEPPAEPPATRAAEGEPRLPGNAPAQCAGRRAGPRLSEQV